MSIDDQLYAALLRSFEALEASSYIAPEDRHALASAESSIMISAPQSGIVPFSPDDPSPQPTSRAHTLGRVRAI